MYSDWYKVEHRAGMMNYIKYRMAMGNGQLPTTISIGINAHSNTTYILGMHLYVPQTSSHFASRVVYMPHRPHDCDIYITYTTLPR